MNSPVSFGTGQGKDTDFKNQLKNHIPVFAKTRCDSVNGCKCNRNTTEKYL